MQKPVGYDESQAFTGEFESIEPGGYICAIKKAAVEYTSTGSEMLVLYFDISDGKYKDFYKRMYERQSVQDEKTKWKGVYRQLTQGNSLPFFKGVMTAIEASNPGYIWNWEEVGLRDKRFGGVFGREEFLDYEGVPRMATKCTGMRSVDAVRAGIDPPADKMLGVKKTGKAAPPAQVGSTYTATDYGDDDLPF